MFNVAVVNIKELIKYLVGLILAIILLIIITRYFSMDKKDIKDITLAKNLKLQEIFDSSVYKNYKKIISIWMPAMGEMDKKEDSTEKKEIESIADNNIHEKILEVELMEVAEEKISDDIQSVEPKDNKEQELQETKNNIGTEIVTENPINAEPTDIYDKVQIRNQTGYVLSDDILIPNIEISNKNIIIFHTHTCESYTSTEQNQYEASGFFRTTDLNYSVARVGDELDNYLTKSGFNVEHDKTFHDYPAYTGSYSRSLNTIDKIKKNNDADIVIDLHRDAIGSNSQYAPTVRINDDYASQLMFVIGTNGGGLWHPNWNQNLKFAIKVQEKAEELYPGLFKPIIVRNSRYNQHIAKAATIIEVGATGNTLEQSITSMKYLAKILEEVVN